MHDESVTHNDEEKKYKYPRVNMIFLAKENGSLSGYSYDVIASINDGYSTNYTLPAKIASSRISNPLMQKVESDKKILNVYCYTQTDEETSINLGDIHDYNS